MTVPIRRPRPVTARRAFSLRQTVLFFALIATALCGAALTLKLMAGAVGDNPVTGVLVTGAVVAAAAWLRKARRRRAAARLAGSLVEATHRAAELPLREPAPAVAGTAGVLPGEPEPTRILPGAGDVLVEPREEFAEPREVFAEPGDVLAEPGVVLDDPGPETFEAADYGAMDALAFEHAVAALCERDGCTDVEVVGGAGDLGADVLATAPDGRRVVVQCKRYGPVNKVGSQEVQRFGGTCFAVHEAQVAVVVTTGEFTGPAADYAAQCGIRCVDHAGLVAWTEGTGPAPWDERVPEAG
ncbi:restriction endonuclease [Streptomyces zhihengii]|uniref:restriction endonuclease n=1 Tax=Streptomyces zhihengii TaxID=1818004 RepID=UPI00369AA6C3